MAKQSEAQLAAGAGIADRVNMLHAGALVLTGRAHAVVTATGAATVIGGIAAALATAPAVAPPLLQRLARFGRTVGLAMGVVVAVLALIQALQGAPADRIFFMAVALAVALAVAAVPEGLPVAITVAWSIASARMAARNVVVRLLPAIEGLGSCTLIASDKTGTLTRNELMVRRIVLPGGSRLTVSGEGYRPVGVIRRDDGADPTPEQWAALRRLAACGLLCNDAGYRPGDDGRVEYFGDTVDVALQALAAKLGCGATTCSRSGRNGRSFRSSRPGASRPPSTTRPAGRSPTSRARPRRSCGCAMTTWIAAPCWPRSKRWPSAVTACWRWPPAMAKAWVRRAGTARGSSVFSV